MRTALLVIALVVSVSVLAVGGLYLWWTSPEAEDWTTRSPEARQELRAGVDDLSRHYYLDAIRHFERALDLDAEMAAAKIFLAQIYAELPDQREAYLKPLRTADPARMNERERLLRTHLLATADGKRSVAREAVDAYLVEHPNDPWALDLKCGEAWQRRDWSQAETCYRRLLEVDRNWVDAQGRLGYIAMAQGRFEEAEELFRTYAFIAPDQAAPHAAVGQLVTVLGRYDEAEKDFERALQVKSDFCEAHLYKVLLHMLRREFRQAQTTLDAMEQIPACSVYDQWGIYCSTRSWLYYLQDDVKASKEEMDSQCLAARGGWDASHQRVAAMTGDVPLATELLAKARQGLDRKDDDPEARIFFLEAIVLHMEGIEKAVTGDWSAACDRFAAADQGVQYWMLSRAAFKLRNRQDLLVCLKQQGRHEDAATLAAEIAAVNPEYLREPMLTDLAKLAGVRIP